MNNSNNSKEKIFTISSFDLGDWVCLLLPNNKKCVGTIIEMLVPNKKEEGFLQSIRSVNYIDEDGLSGNIRVDELTKTQRIVGVDFDSFFIKNFKLKAETIKIENASRKIAREYKRKASLKKLGKIINN